MFERENYKKIAIDHSADIDYQDFLKIYRNCAKDLYYFLTINTTLPSSDPLKYRKSFFDAPL